MALKSFAWFIGLRYTRSKKRNHFVSFISMSSMLGIALGVMVLVTVLSVMNGFDEEIHNRFFGMAPEITITGADNRIQNWQALIPKITALPDVVAVAPFVGGQGMMTAEGRVVPIIISGIDSRYEENVTHLKEKLLGGKLSNLTHFGVIIGKGLAENLGVLIGDTVSIMIPQASVSPAGMIPRFKRFTVAGVFSAGTGFNFDTKLAFLDIGDAQKLFQLGNAITGLKIKINNVYKAPLLSKQLQTMLGDDYFVGNWTEQFGEFFQAVKLEKSMMFLILLLIIAVAAFNLVSSLVMVVNDKRAEIAILRTLGATPGTILRIFIIQGLLVGVIGTALGLGLGLLLACNATSIVNHIQDWFGVRFLSSNIYFVDYLPSKVLSSDLLKICTAALSMSFIATIYPAYRASKTPITEALHNE